MRTETIPLNLANELNGRSLAKAVRDYEERLVQAALDECGGRVTPAGRLLGLTHQAMACTVRRLGLEGFRSPVRIRRKPLIKTGSRHKSVQRRVVASPPPPPSRVRNEDQWHREAL